MITLYYEGEICPLNQKSTYGRYQGNSSKYKTSFKALEISFKSDKQHLINARAIDPRLHATGFPITENVFVNMTFSRKHRSDIDSLLKVIFDALQKSGIIKNDRQIQTLNVTRDDETKLDKLKLEIGVLNKSN